MSDPYITKKQMTKNGPKTDFKVALKKESFLWTYVVVVVVTVVSTPGTVTVVDVTSKMGASEVVVSIRIVSGAESVDVLIASVGDASTLGVDMRLSGLLKLHIDENTNVVLSLSIDDDFSVVNNNSPIIDRINPVEHRHQTC
jgi:hypothetical protein